MAVLRIEVMAVETSGDLQGRAQQPRREPTLRGDDAQRVFSWPDLRRRILRARAVGELHQGPQERPARRPPVVPPLRGERVSSVAARHRYRLMHALRATVARVAP